jgi:hypothetical protein
MPVHTKYAKTCSIKLQIFIPIIMKRTCISLCMFSGVVKKKKKSKCMNLQVLLPSPPPEIFVAPLCKNLIFYNFINYIFYNFITSYFKYFYFEKIIST